MICSFAYKLRVFCLFFIIVIGSLVIFKKPFIPASLVYAQCDGGDSGDSGDADIPSSSCWLRCSNPSVCGGLECSFYPPGTSPARCRNPYCRLDQDCNCNNCDKACSNNDQCNTLYGWQCINGKCVNPSCPTDSPNNCCCPIIGPSIAPRGEIPWTSSPTRFSWSPTLPNIIWYNYSLWRFNFYINDFDSPRLVDAGSATTTSFNYTLQSRNLYYWYVYQTQDCPFTSVDEAAATSAWVYFKLECLPSYSVDTDFDPSKQYTFSTRGGPLPIIAWQFPDGTTTVNYDTVNNTWHTVTFDSDGTKTITVWNIDPRSNTARQTATCTLVLSSGGTPAVTLTPTPSTTGALTPTTILTPTPTLTATQWYKIKNGSLYKKHGINLTVYNAKKFAEEDSDDNGSLNIIIDNKSAGSAVSSGTFSLVGNITSDSISAKGWRATGYSFSQEMITGYYNYVKARKEYVTITDINSITQQKINVFSGNPNLTTNTINGKTPFVLIVDGTVTIDRAVGVDGGDSFNLDASPLAIIAQTITFNNNVVYANGIFIAQNFNLGSNANGLKIKGNLISQSEIPTSGFRQRTEPERPSLFVVVDPNQYLQLLPYLSIAKYDWQQKQ